MCDWINEWVVVKVCGTKKSKIWSDFLYLGKCGIYLCGKKKIIYKNVSYILFLDMVFFKGKIRGEKIVYFWFIEGRVFVIWGGDLFYRGSGFLRWVLKDVLELNIIIEIW